MTKSIITFLYIKGDKHNLMFTQTSKYVLEMTGYKPGTLHIGSLVDTRTTEHLPQAEGPYLHAGLDASVLGFSGKVNHFDIRDGKVQIHLQQ